MDMNHHTPSRLIVLASIALIVLGQAWGSGVKSVRADVPPVAPPLATATKVPRTAPPRPSPTPVPRRAGARTSRALTGAATYTLLTENFDASDDDVLPSNWAWSNFGIGSGEWFVQNATDHPGGQLPHSLPHLLRFNSYNAGNGEQALLYSTTGLDFRARSNISVTFWIYHISNPDWASYPDRVQPAISTNHGEDWTSYGDAVLRYAGEGIDGWTQHTVDITAGGGQADSWIGLWGISANGDDCNIDDVSVTVESQVLYLPFISK